jgi:hypothetical protein
MNANSTFVAEFEVVFSSYEAIKQAVAEDCQNDYKVDPAQSFEREYKMHELPESCIVEYRNCVYTIKPSSLDASNTFLISAYTYFDATDLECFKSYLTCQLSHLCDCLKRLHEVNSNEVVVVNLETDWIDKYIEDNRIRSSNSEQAEEKPLYDDDDIYVYDGVNIYE